MRKLTPKMEEAIRKAEADGTVHGAIGTKYGLMDRELGDFAEHDDDGDGWVVILNAAGRAEQERLLQA